MGKLWDALKKAERESSSEYVSEYEKKFEGPPAEYAGELSLELTPNMVEEYRKLYHNMRRISDEQKRKFKLIMVTAPSFGDGATTIAASLAAGIASDKRDTKVLLLDMNLRQPEIHTLFGFQPAPGIVEAVLDPEQGMEFFRSSPLRLVPNLHVMTAGNIDLTETNPIEIIENRNLGVFLEKLKDIYDVVVIDSAPVIQYSDSVSLARLVDGAILVVDAQATRWEVASKARDQLVFADAFLLGVVLNKRKLVIPKLIYRRL